MADPSGATAVPPPAGPAAIPPPPPGPGVQPPFAAAPVEGRSARLWLGLGVAGALLVVCCGVGAVALGGFVLTGVQALNEQAERAVGDYLEAVIEEDWEQAYELRCEEDRQEDTLEEFTRRVSDQPPIESYELGELDLTTGDLELPAELTYLDGETEDVLVPLEQDTGTGQLEVCGWDR